jgi:hypothetical protein
MSCDLRLKSAQILTKKQVAARLTSFLGVRVTVVTFARLDLLESLFRCY